MQINPRWIAGAFVFVVVGLPLAAETDRDRMRLRDEVASRRDNMPAATAGDAHWCPTSEANTIRQQRFAAWASAREASRPRNERRVKAASASPAARYADGVFLVTADDQTTPFDRPVDLVNSSLMFTRSGNGFTVQKTELVYDFDRGPSTAMQNWKTTGVALPFQFPFFSGSHGNITVGTNNAIYFGSVPTSSARQFFELDVAMFNFPVAAPLMVPTDRAGNFGYYYMVHVKSTASAVTITWRTTYAGEFEKDIQAVLFSNGDIRFSYRTVTNLAGAVVVSPDARAYYAGVARNVLVNSSDPGGDQSASVPAQYASQVDIVGISASRLTDTNMLEVTLTLSGAISQGALPPGTSLFYILEFGTTSEERAVNGVWVEIRYDRIVYSPPGQGGSTNGGQVTLSGSTVKTIVLDDVLALNGPDTAVQVWALHGPSWNGDYASTPVSLGPDGPDLALDFSTFTSASSARTSPLFEPFTFPIVNVGAVWTLLKTAFNFTDTDTDAVSIYQNFLTDLILYAGGYATVGVHGDTGVSGHCTQCPFTPNLLHLDRLGRGWNRSVDGAMSLLLHEFGHRWLYFIKTRENGVDTNNLNPDGAHPRQGAHLPAAFPVLGAYDVSTMGGGYFTQTGPSTYATPQNMHGAGYSWNELYLMGLAAPNEVVPWFYLTGQGLDGWYNAAWNTTFNVNTRTNVDLSQIVSAMGARDPVYPNARKAFRNLFVILERAGEPVTPAAIASFGTNYITPFGPRFNNVTGGRGSVTHLPANLPLAMPTGVVATAGNATTVNVLWNAVASATGYQILRSASGTENFTQIGTSVAASYTDSTAAPNTAYLYRVRATNGPTTSPESSYELATTVVFTDPQLTSGTAVKAVHFTQLRTAVNAVRALAGLAAGVYTDPSLTSGTRVKRLHVTEPRAALDAARAALALAALSYTDGTISAGITRVKQLHVDEIRAGTR
jgi:hypothetical protein